LGPIIAERLAAAAIAVYGSSAAWWPDSLAPLNQAEVSNEIWTATLEGRPVFVKRHLRPDRYRNEISALALATRAGIQVPDALLKIDELNVLVLATLDGTPLNAAWPRLDNQQRHKISAQAGALVARLHAACPGPAFGIKAAPGPEVGAGWLEYVHVLLDRWLRVVANEPFPVPWSEVRDTFARYAATSPFTCMPCLAHFDISARNLVVAPPPDAGDITLGLLDFELARYDHPGMDFHNSMGAKWLEYDETLTAAFRRGVAGGGRGVRSTRRLFYGFRCAEHAGLSRENRESGREQAIPGADSCEPAVRPGCPGRWIARLRDAWKAGAARKP
jgi:Ser/Thr protein kinase RdoA (MazF antagonist)